MNKNFLPISWMIFLSLLLLSLIYWSIFHVEDMQQKISIFGIVAVISAAVTSVLTVSINNRKARERDYELHILKEKQKVYEHFYNCYFEILINIKKGKDGLSKKAEEEMLLFKKGLMNWGSEQIIRKYLHFESRLVENRPDYERFHILKEGDSFIKELRKELGYRDSNKTNIMSIILTAEARRELVEEGMLK